MKSLRTGKLLRTIPRGRERGRRTEDGGRRKEETNESDGNGIAIGTPRRYWP
jgi:hypothetical protein